ncbi:hypothetical protein [Nocardia sp. NPDC056100]|uniref:hypothetical protein n=1 Tax=Nocardia sp. NPDC056100 TaxID=3345712 RepID=UPI0035D9172C
MKVNSLPQRVFEEVLGVEPYRVADDRPPAIAGYSVAHRVLAGLLGVRLPERDRIVPNTGVDHPLDDQPVEPVMERRDDPPSSKTSPITDATSPLSAWDVSTRLHLRVLVVKLIEQLEIVEGVASRLDRAFATNQALGLHDSIIRANAIGDVLANAVGAAEDIAANDPRADALVHILDEASGLTDLFAQGQGFGDALANDLATARANLTRIANDFQDADVRDIELGEVFLAGVRWNAATLWPSEWLARIRNASVEEEAFSGVFVIQAQPDPVFESVLT